MCGTTGGERMIVFASRCAWERKGCFFSTVVASSESHGADDHRHLSLFSRYFRSRFWRLIESRVGGLRSDICVRSTERVFDISGP